MRSLGRFGLVVGADMALLIALSGYAAQAAAPRKSPGPAEGPARPRADLQAAHAAVLEARTLRLAAVCSAPKTAAEALLIAQQVRSMHLEGQVRAADTFYKKRERREQYLAKHRRARPGLETYVKVCNATRPQRLAPYHYDPEQGAIHWPKVLQGPEFDEHRRQLDALFVSRGSAGPRGEGGLRPEVERLARQMRERLKGKVRHVSQMEYLAAKKLLTSLAYEAQFTPQLESIAAK